MQEVYFADYDYKTRVKAIRRGKARIRENGSAAITLDNGQRLHHKPGHYLKKEEFELYWRGCIEQKARQMANELNQKASEGKDA